MLPSRLVAFVVALVAALLLTPDLHAQRGAITAPRNLAELTDASHVIVRGFVVGAQVAPHPQLQGLSTVMVTIKVRETLKGPPVPKLVFRQFIWDFRDKVDAAGYRKGQDLLLMLNKPSHLGLTSPVGLEQGRFRIIADRSGQLRAVNGHANAALFKGAGDDLQRRGVRLSNEESRMLQQSQGAVPLSTFMGLIRQIALRDRK